MADNSELDKMRLAAMMNKSPATGGLKATNTVTPSFSMNTPIEQAYSRWKQDNSIAAKLLRGEQMSGEDIAKDLSYQLQDATQHPENFLGTIKAVGNLNLVPRIAKETLKGPETQTLQSFMNQVKQTPGVTKEGLKSAAASLQYIKPDTKMTKAEFEAYLKPSRYQKVDLGTKHTEDVMEHLYNEAHEAITTNDVFNKMGIPANLRSYADDMINNQIYMGELPESVQTAFRSRGFNTEMDVHNAWFDTRDTMVHDYANDLLENGGFGETEKYPPEGYRYKQYQRLTPENANAGYFEFGVTHPAQKAAYRHYKGEEDPAGLIGHVRGTHITEPTNVATGSKNWLKAEPGSSIIEEIQSDAQKVADQTGHLHQVHGTLAKAAIQDALEKGSHTVYMPTSRAIGSVRGSPGGEYASIYDDAIIKEALGPLQHVPGVKITPPKETPYSYPWTRDTTADAYNLLGIPHKQHESAKIFLSAPTGGKERLMNKSQNLLNQLDADQTTLEVLGNMETRPWYMDDTINAAKDKQATYNAHQDFIKWIDEKFPETPGNNDRFEQGQKFSDAVKAVAAKRQSEIEAMKNNPNEMPYYKIEFSPEAIEHILKGPGQTTPGYKQGGAVDMDKIRYALAMRKADGGEVKEPDTSNKKPTLIEQYKQSDTPLANLLRNDIEGAKQAVATTLQNFAQDPYVGLSTSNIGKVTPSLIAKVRDRLLNEKQGGDQLARRLERAADEVPNLEKQFDERGLFDLFGRVNAGYSGNRPNLIKVIHPLEFSSKYAAELPTMGRKEILSKTDVGDGLKSTGKDLSNADYVDYLANEVLKNQGGFNRVPSLSLEYRDYGKDSSHIIQPHGTPQLYIGGHEGRHRTAALDRAGFDKTLVEFDPRSDLRNLLINKVKSEPPVYRDRDAEGYTHFFDQDRFLNNFKKLFGDSPKIAPEVERDPVFFKDFFKQGGTVHMAGGGQPNNKFSYASGLADLAGLDEEYYNANTIPLQHFDKSTEHNGPADAMRHMLFQAQITKNHSPTLAKIISQGHERLLDWGQPDAEQAMDFHNDALGREIGAKAKSIDEMTQMAKDAIMSGRAKVIGHDLPGKYYKLGGNVKNVSTNTGNHGNIALTTAQIRANLLRKKHG